jgi:hypothetical protein
MGGGAESVGTHLPLMPYTSSTASTLQVAHASISGLFQAQENSTQDLEDEFEKGRLALRWNPPTNISSRASSGAAAQQICIQHTQPPIRSVHSLIL